MSAPSGSQEQNEPMSQNEQTEPVDHNDFNQNLIAEYRANGGKVTGMFANTPLLL
jgi:hypothetical protein